VKNNLAHYTPLISLSEQIDTRNGAAALKGLQEAFSAAESIYQALPECGGVATGDICAAATSGAKIGFAAAFAVAQLVSMNNNWK
jgi:hypothetical protein